MSTLQKIEELWEQQKEISQKLEEVSGELVGKHATMKPEFLDWVQAQYRDIYHNRKIIRVFVDYDASPLGSICLEFEGHVWDTLSVYEIVEEE